MKASSNKFSPLGATSRAAGSVGNVGHAGMAVNKGGGMAHFTIKEKAYTRLGCVYVKPGFQCPPVCIISGKEMNPRLHARVRKKISYTPPWAFALALATGLIGTVVMCFVAKSMYLEVYVSKEHAKKIGRSDALLVLGLGLGLTCFVISIFVMWLLFIALGFVFL